MLLALLVNAIRNGNDFYVFFKAALRTLSHEPIYQASDGADPFKYHPFWALLFTPLALLPGSWALGIFTFFQMGCWALSLKHFLEWSKWGPLSFKQLLFFLVLTLNTFSAELGYGQMNGLLLFLVLTSVHWAKDDRNLPWVGFFFCLMSLAKLNFLVLGLFFVLFRPKVIFWSCLWMLPIHFLTTSFFGRGLWDNQIYLDWFSLLFSQSKDQYFTYEVQGLLRALNLVTPSSLLTATWGILAAVYGFGLLWILRRLKNSEASFFKICVVSYLWAGLFLLSPLAWWYQSLWMFPMALVLWRFSRNSNLVICASVGVVLFATMSFSFFGREGLIAIKTAMVFFAASMLILGSFLVFIFRNSKSLDLGPKSLVSQRE